MKHHHAKMKMMHHHRSPIKKKCHCERKIDLKDYSAKEKTSCLAITGVLLAVGAWWMYKKHCKTIPEGAVAVSPFDKTRYLGQWYEIARLDYSHESGLEQVTAHYSMNMDGTIKVVNRGYNPEKGEWEEAVGKAKPAGEPHEGKLKVSFFGPFYAGYNVIAIDHDYRYALVIGHSHKYMWLLSRERSMPEDVKEAFLMKARELGYDTSKLTWTRQHE